MGNMARTKQSGQPVMTERDDHPEGRNGSTPQQAAALEPALGLTRRMMMRGLGLGVASSAAALAIDARPAGAAVASGLDAGQASGALGTGLEPLTGTATSLLSSNPVLPAGAHAFATDTNQLWVGNGLASLNDIVPFETPSGTELGSATDGDARSFSNVTTDYPNLSIGPFIIPPGKIGYIHLLLPSCFLTSTTTYGSFSIVHGAASAAPENTSIDDGNVLIVGTGYLHTTVDKTAVARVGSGTYTVKVRAFDAPAPGSTEVNFLGASKARLWAVLA